MKVLMETQFAGLTPAVRGKVRDIYNLDDKLLIVATDRLSAFDIILPTPIPDKGRVLTQLSLFWFNLLRDIISNHVLSATDFPPPFDKFNDELTGRSMVVRKAQPLPIECVVRGYVSGSGWKDYRVTGKICGIPLPTGLRESDRLPEPIFSPATKAVSGHDENISFEQMAKLVGPELSRELRDLSLKIYNKAADYARRRGIIIADTKFEFGRTPQGITLADEVLTPDSSRFWPADKYQPGRSQESFDKQYVRNYLEEIGWNKQPPAPALPAEVARKTSEKYLEAYHRLTGRELDV